MRRTHHTPLAIAMVVSATLLAPTSLSAQSTFGTLTGTVTDPTAAVIPAATVTVLNVRTAVERSTTTDAAGAYQVQNLDAGRYRITVAFAGFQEQTRETDLLARQTVR